jgi:hypothetical protein
MHPAGYETYWQYTTALACSVLAATNPAVNSAANVIESFVCRPSRYLFVCFMDGLHFCGCIRKSRQCTTSHLRRSYRVYARRAVQNATNEPGGESPPRISGSVAVLYDLALWASKRFGESLPSGRVKIDEDITDSGSFDRMMR